MSSPSLSSSSSTVTLARESRPEAEPLPSKIGEIGYIAQESSEVQQLSTNTVSIPSLPARHPADRTSEPSSRASITAPPIGPIPVPSPTIPANNVASSSKKSWSQRLSVGGVSPLSITRVVLLLLFIAGTSAAWAITITKFGSAQGMDNSNTSSTPSPDGQTTDTSNNVPYGSPTFSSLVIVHVSFTIVTLVELLFLERSVFHARAERYLHKHGMPRGASNVSMGIAPWNRPSLPTYAAALTEIGVGTGDVEDNLIAIPPPPAYGNTRGSKLLLRGMLRESLIRQLNRISQQSSVSMTPSSHSPASPREMEEGGRSRPLSYDASEEVDNAKRALDLEAALTKLESR